MLKGNSRVETVALAIYVLCFSVATMFHVLALVRGGWLPFTLAPAAMNWFWTLLTFADPAVLLLLITGRRRAGLALALLIMVLDVGVNSYALFGLGYSDFSMSLLLQTAFLGFVLGSIGFLWRFAPIASR